MLIARQGQPFQIIDHQQKVVKVPRDHCVLYLPENDYPLRMWDKESRKLLIDTMTLGYAVEMWSTDGLCHWVEVNALPLYGDGVYRSTGVKTDRAHVVTQKHILQKIRELQNEIEQLKDKLDAPTENFI